MEFSGENAPYSAVGRYYLRTADEGRGSHMMNERLSKEIPEILVAVIRKVLANSFA